MKNAMKRVWINAPSRLQQDHKHHGRKLLVREDDLKSKEPVIDAWTIDGDSHSMRVFANTLSPGWPLHL